MILAPGVNFALPYLSLPYLRGGQFLGCSMLSLLSGIGPIAHPRCNQRSRKPLRGSCES